MEPGRFRELSLLATLWLHLVWWFKCSCDFPKSKVLLYNCDQVEEMISKGRQKLRNSRWRYIVRVEVHSKGG